MDGWMADFELIQFVDLTSFVTLFYDRIATKNDSKYFEYGDAINAHIWMKHSSPDLEASKMEKKMKKYSESCFAQIRKWCQNAPVLGF